MTEQQLPETQKQGERPLLTPEGFVDLSVFAGILPEDTWNLSDDEFSAWAEKRAKLEDGEPILMARFHRPQKGEFMGKMVSYDLGKRGTLVMDGLGAAAEPHLPYVVSIVGETNHNLQLGLVRRPTIEDCVHYRKQPAEEKIEIQQLSLKATDVLEEDESHVMGRESSGRLTFLRKDLSGKAKDPVREGDYIVAIEPIPESKRHSFFVPVCLAERWERTSVFLDQIDLTPIVSKERFNGIQPIDEKQREIRGVDGLAQVMPDLSRENQAILARLWNIYWGKELQKRKDSFQESVRDAKHAAWEAYKAGTIAVEHGRQYREIDEDGLVKEHYFVPVAVNRERFDIEPSNPEGTLQRYSGDLKAYTAAEVFAIIESKPRFLEYLSSEEGIGVKFSALERLRPEHRFIDTQALKETAEYQGKNGLSWAGQPIAVKEFEKVSGEIIEFQDGAAKFCLAFAPTLYVRQVPQEYPGVATQFQKEFFGIGYLLEDVEIEYMERFQAMPEHIQQRIRGMIEACIDEMRRPSWIRPDDNGRVRWLAGKEWETPEAEGLGKPSSNPS